MVVSYSPGAPGQAVSESAEGGPCDQYFGENTNAHAMFIVAYPIVADLCEQVSTVQLRRREAYNLAPGWQRKRQRIQGSPG